MPIFRHATKGYITKITENSTNKHILKYFRAAPDYEELPEKRKQKKGITLKPEWYEAVDGIFD